jgi:hypothetical protein
LIKANKNRVHGIKKLKKGWASQQQTQNNSTFWYYCWDMIHCGWLGFDDFVLFLLLINPGFHFDNFFLSRVGVK